MINGEGDSWLNGVVDISPSEAWAVGLCCINTFKYGSAIEHWDGTQWSLFPGPEFGPEEEPEIAGMTAVSADDIWAVGTMAFVGGGNNQTLFEHWDGTSWTAQLGPGYGFFKAVSADATDDVWAVGTTLVETFS